MDLDLEFDSDCHVARICIRGRVCGNDLKRAIISLYENQYWQPGYNAFWDWRGVQELDFSPLDLQEVRKVQEALAPRMGHGRGAIVTRRDMDTEIASLLALHMRRIGRERRVFLKLDEAAEWLGLGATSDSLDNHARH